MGVFNGNSIYNEGDGGGGGGGGVWEDVSDLIWDVPGWLNRSNVSLFYNSAADLYNIQIYQGLISANYDTTYTLAFYQKIIAGKHVQHFKTYTQNNPSNIVSDVIWTNEMIDTVYEDFRQDRFRFIIRGSGVLNDQAFAINYLFRAYHE